MTTPDEIYSNGFLHDLTQLTQYGAYDLITGGEGVEYVRFLALMRDLIADARKTHKNTSASSLTIGTGTKVFTLDTTAGLIAELSFLAVSRSNSANRMSGTIDSYDDGVPSVTCDVTVISGSGSVSDWDLYFGGGDVNLTINGLAELEDDTTPTLGGNLDAAAKIISNAVLKDTAEETFDLGATISGALVIDYENGHYQSGTVTGNITSLTINNLPASGKVGFGTIKLTQGGAGGFTIALATKYNTVGGGAITLSLVAGEYDKIRWETDDNGTIIDTFINANLS